MGEKTFFENSSTGCKFRRSFEIIINGSTHGKTLKAQAESPFNEADINRSGFNTIETMINPQKTVKIISIFFKKPPLLFDLKTLF